MKKLCPRSSLIFSGRDDRLVGGLVLLLIVCVAVAASTRSPRDIRITETV